MNEINCEKVLLAKMAEMDGEETELSAEQINLHLATCANCWQEIEQMQAADHLLNRQTRREQTAELWAAIETRIGAQEVAQKDWKPLAWLGALLVTYKVIELLPAQNFGLAFNLVPLVLIAATFVLLKENPFKVNDELALERETYE